MVFPIPPEKPEIFPEVRLADHEKFANGEEEDKEMAVELPEQMVCTVGLTMRSGTGFVNS